MPQQTASAVENNFSAGLKTEFTALNFPENACTETDNCVFSLDGEVVRRAGFDLEANYTAQELTTTGVALSSYVWDNVGGDGRTKIYVVQCGDVLKFYRSSDATETLPLSQTILASTVTLTTFSAGGADIDEYECQYTDGNGYLFVFHPYLEPFYCTYSAGTITATAITIKIRDFTGISESNVATQYRAASLTNPHSYNLANQGWSSAPAWTATSSSTVLAGTGSKVFTVGAGLPIVNGTPVYIVGGTGGGSTSITMSGTVTSYAGTTLTLNISSFTGSGLMSNWTINPVNLGLLTTWNTSQGNYPSNADVWWRFKNSSGVFDPATTQPNVTLGTGPSQKGFYILDAFNQNRSSISGVASLTPITTTIRPKTGTWFQGRIWYAGVDASQAATGDQLHYTWTENIYFSQVVETSMQFGMCYQNNDPTSEDFFDLLPTDGGVITIPGCGSVYKLFPIQNGLLVFSANGIWFVTGSQGIGFSANDYTVTRISSVQSIAGSSFINVLGFPMFWNEEGIYLVHPAQQGGGLVVDNLCQGTILSFYNDIPSISKRYARGDYNPITFTASWVYKDIAETGIGNRYQFNRVLNFNTSNKAFYPYSIAVTLGTTTATPVFHDVKYINNPGGSALSSPSLFKYITSYDYNKLTFSEERDDENWIDFRSYSGADVPYESYFITGYKLHGKAIFKWQPIYVQMYSRADVPTAYKIQGIWDYANDGNSGKFSNIQVVTNALTRFGTIYRRHKIRGRGISLQIKVISVDGLPFQIMGWASHEAINTGP